MKGNTIFVVIFTVIIILIAVANFFKLQALKIVFSVLLLIIGIIYFLFFDKFDKKNGR